jgi:hypothetical protein
MTVNAEGDLDLFNHFLSDASHVVRKTAAIGVTEYDAMRFTGGRGA